MLLGLDFDNTLVTYDKLFYELALEKSLINTSMPPTKKAIRDYLRSVDNENSFTLLQGEVYGSCILRAEPSPGMINALLLLKSEGFKTVLVSHKTRHPYAGPKYDLHEAALSWLDKHKFFSDSFMGWKSSDVFFEPTKLDKINKICSLNCTHYIDDLPEILDLIPDSITRVLYSPTTSQSLFEGYKVLSDWSKAIPEFFALKK